MLVDGSGSMDQELKMTSVSFVAERVLEALNELLTNPAASDRLIAAETLRMIGGKRVTGQFIERFSAETDPEIRDALWDEYRKHTGLKK